jgi:hypothetical protein
MVERKLHHWELDRYWVRVLWMAICRSWKAVVGKFGWRTVITISTAIIAALIQFLYLGWNSAVDNLKIVGSSKRGFGASDFLISAREKIDQPDFGKHALTPRERPVIA